MMIDRSTDKACAIVSYLSLAMDIFELADTSDAYKRIKRIVEINNFMKEQISILYGLNKAYNPERLIKDLVITKKLLNYPLNRDGFIL